MKAPAFWLKPFGFKAAALWPLGLIYGFITLKRMEKAGYKAKIPVVCVGNPTLGGVGKTPFVRALAELLIKKGHHPVILSRGYGGSLTGPLQVLPTHKAREVGDEPMMLAQNLPVIIARDRAAGARLAETEGFDCIIMDDGFQNPSLHKDVSFLLIDNAVGLGNGAVFPAGPLRAPFKPQALMADCILTIGEGEATLESYGKPMMKASITPLNAEGIRGKNLLAFCGLGRPDKFSSTLTKLGARDVELRAFADHHPYTPADCAALMQHARQKELLLVTTEKDAIKLKDFNEGRALLAQTYVLKIGLSYDEGSVYTFIKAGFGQNAA